MTGAPLIEAYGLTETSPAVCINPLNLADYNGSIGLPIPSTELSIRDDENREAGIGQDRVGEICVRGPQVMRGYWNRPDETAKVMTEDGFLRTGDIGYMDERGYTRIVDRKKDLIPVSYTHLGGQAEAFAVTDFPGQPFDKRFRTGPIQIDGGLRVAIQGASLILSLIHI